jgi:ketosteroid isomerase-like protein
MSEENVEIVRRAFAGRALQETAETYWHPQIEYIEDPRFPGASSYAGREAVVRCWLDYLEAMGDEKTTTVAVENVFDAGERQVAFVRFQGRATGSGIPFDHLWGYIVKVKDGQLVHVHAYYEPAEALEAAGLSEQATEDRDQEIIARLRRTYEAFNREDFDAAIEIADPDIELITTGGMTKLRGADKFRAWMEPETIEDILMEPERFEVVGNNVLVRVLSRGRGVGSGISVEMHFWSVWTINDEGRVTRIVAFNDNEEAKAREAAGLSE